jgi:hypothetical protein
MLGGVFIRAGSVIAASGVRVVSGLIPYGFVWTIFLASQWRKIEREFPDFAGDAINLWFGLSTDGMNPFGE